MNSMKMILVGLAAMLGAAGLAQAQGKPVGDPRPG
jgi:hypothetical protein